MTRQREVSNGIANGIFLSSIGNFLAQRYQVRECAPDDGAVEDTNGPNLSGVGGWPLNNLEGWRMSAVITHLNPMRHRLNLMVRGGVFVRKVLIKDLKVMSFPEWDRTYLTT